MWPTRLKEWRIDEVEANHLVFRKNSWFVFVGFKRPNDQIKAFGTGMPAGDFVDGAPAVLLASELVLPTRAAP